MPRVVCHAGAMQQDCSGEPRPKVGGAEEIDGSDNVVSQYAEGCFAADFFKTPGKEPSVGGHNIEGDGVIARKAKAPTEPAEATPQGQSRGTGVRHSACGGRQPESGAFMIELTQE